MEMALTLAKKAFSQQEIPIGAVVVSPEYKIIGFGFNKTERLHMQSRHAEMCAIERANRLLKDWRLEGCTLYVTLQPCMMCVGLMYLSRISRLVYGATSPLFGYDLDNEQVPSLYKKHIKGVSTGVLAEESQQLLEQFFRKKRN